MRIAFIGGMGAGKTTAKWAVQPDDPVGHMRFSAPVYEIAEDYFPDFNGAGEAERRRVLQGIGDKMREIDPDVWVNHFALHLAEIEQYRPDLHLVVDDLRYPNEYEYLKAHGFVVARVNTPMEVRAARRKMTMEELRVAEQHPSEQHWRGMKTDYELDGTNQAAMERAIATIIKELS